MDDQSQPLIDMPIRGRKRLTSRAEPVDPFVPVQEFDRHIQTLDEPLPLWAHAEELGCDRAQIAGMRFRGDDLVDQIDSAGDRATVGAVDEERYAHVKRVLGSAGRALSPPL
jgi:hypothetical protein